METDYKNHHSFIKAHNHNDDSPCNRKNLLLGLFYQVPQNQGALFAVTNTIDTYVYRGLLELGNMSMSSAAGLYQSIIGFILILSANLAVKKIEPDSALF